jgi:hypothetical protein
VGQEVVTDGDRLRPLEVRVARHRQRGVSPCLGSQSLHQLCERASDRGTRGPAVKTQVQRNLVVPGAPRVQPGAGLWRQLGEPALNCRVDVLVRLPEDEAAVLDLRRNLAQPALGGLELLLAEKTGGTQAASVGDRTGDVVGSQINVDFE